jgi:uncharacterized protein
MMSVPVLASAVRRVQPRSPATVLQLILKVSKLCNLRCRYCYEYPHLGDRSAMSLEQLEAMYLNVRDYYAAGDDPPAIQWIWHGGEPLLQPVDFYKSTIRRQREVFGGDLKVTNVVQTNLVALDDARIDLLASFFDGVGVSVDLFGDLRLDLAGQSRERAVLANMDRLSAAGIPFGCISVLSGANKDHVERMFAFYAQMEVSWRLLPLFRGATADQHKDWGIGARDTLSAMCRVADLWFASDAPIEAEPLATHIAAVLRHRGPDRDRQYYRRRDREHMILVNVDGELYSHGDACEPDTSWGNIFTTPLEAIFSGARYAESVRRSERRMAGACVRCEYFGGCSGFPVAEENFVYHDVEDACPVVRPLLAHIERRLEHAGILPERSGAQGPSDTVERSAEPAR